MQYENYYLLCLYFYITSCVAYSWIPFVLEKSIEKNLLLQSKAIWSITKFSFILITQNIRLNVRNIRRYINQV